MIRQSAEQVKIKHFVVYIQIPTQHVLNPYRICTNNLTATQANQQVFLGYLLNQPKKISFLDYIGLALLQL